MISLLFKNWKFLLDAVLIIALVVLIFLWNPFGIFGGGLKLGTTANMVTEVRDIGQLVTAEYYGEVIASIDETRLAFFDRDSLGPQANLMYSDLKHALYNLYQYQQLAKDERIRDYRDNKDLYTDVNFLNWGRVFKQDVDRKNVLDKLNHHNPQIRSSHLYGEVIEYLWRDKMNNRENASWDVKERHEEQVLFTLYHELVTAQSGNNAVAFQAYLSQGFDDPQQFNAFYGEDFTSELSRSEQKKKLAMVGRGWVKAGFDFSTLDEHSFYFHEESSELHLFGMEPKILNADINPWFIPEKGIPGFEVIDYNGKVNFKDAKKVKEYCIQKLTLYAHRADIIGNAQRQGEETLKSFFSLLTGKEVKKVHFHHDKLVQVANEIARDEFVNYYEAVLLDSLIAEEIRLIDSLKATRYNRTDNLQKIQLKQNMLKTTLGRLRKLPFEDTGYSFGYYSTIAFRIARDETLDWQEQKEVERVRWNHMQQQTDKLDTLNLDLWYEDSLSLMMEYNAALGYLIEKCRWIDQKSDTLIVSPDRENWKSGIDSNYFVLDSIWAGDSLQLSFSQTDSLTSPAYLVELMYPFQYDPEAFTRYTRSKTLFGTVISPAQDTTLAANDSLLWVYTNTSQESMQSLHISPGQFLNKYILASAQAGLQADSLFFVFASSTVKLPQDTSKLESPLNEQQSRELLAYFQLIRSKHEDFRHKGSIVRASEWVQAKLSKRKNLEFSFAEVKRFINE